MDGGFYPFLQFFWNLGFLPIMERPAKKGMRVPTFLDLLSHGEYKDKRHQYKGIWLIKPEICRVFGGDGC